MGKVRYLGSKARLVHSISQLLGSPKTNHRFVDLFCGTGVVSHTVGMSGWPILANDTLNAATILTTARLVSKDQVPFDNLGGYKSTILKLNELKGVKGFFYREYSNSKKNKEKIARPYFTLENACKIDAIRIKIKEWDSAGAINSIEKKLLLADLIESTNQVANIAGTYGCFLKDFSDPSLRSLKISERIFSDYKIRSNVLNLDAFDVTVGINDIVYIDPPYTKRQYAAYYHIPETLACEDEPEVEGITGLRPWKNKASLFCYKAKAPKALKNLFEGLSCNRILLSYSSDGHIPFQDVVAIARIFGEITITKFEDFGRYAPNVISRNNAKKRNLVEYIVEINR